ncbi:hypothetical protein [Desulfobulbus elongatus]|uniref:hypothetical protein n=1 Tax=Desulfobulbus elongatus TaxID=53332 RepID=UPI000A91B07D|nr:hypothetical protein [Desulfobulbus elongatus]
MTKVLLMFFSRVESRLLRRLLARFIDRQLASPYYGSSELVDCATVLLDEVAP